MAGRSERLVITGAGGQLGSHLTAQAAREGRDMLALTSSQWDITDPAAAERIIRHGDVVINCAAYTDVDAPRATRQSPMRSMPLARNTSPVRALVWVLG